MAASTEARARWMSALAAGRSGSRWKRPGRALEARAGTYRVLRGRRPGSSWCAAARAAPGAGSTWAR